MLRRPGLVWATQVQLAAVRWSLTVWPCLTNILVVRESNISPWISLFLSLFSLSPSHSPIFPSISPWWTVFPGSALGPDIPFPHLYLHPREHTLAHTHTQTHRYMLTNVCTHLDISLNPHLFSHTETCTHTHAHTSSKCWWALSRVLRAQQRPLWILNCSLLIYLSSCLPLLPFSLCVVFSPSLYIYLTPIAFSGNSKPDR